jgi:hypothetical protein
MTRGQEIANEWFNIGVPVGTDTKQQLAMTIDAAIAEAKRKTRQEFADVLRDAKCRCHELVNLHNGIHCEDVKQTIKDIDSILALSIPPARPAESRSLNRGC